MKHQSSKVRSIALSLCIGLAISGCGSQQTKPVSQMSAAEKAQLAKAQDQVNDVVNTAVNRFESADKAGVARYSQVFFPDAKTDLAKLREMHKGFNPNKAGIFDSGYSLEQIKEQSASLTQNVQRAEQAKSLITTHLNDVIDNQNYIETLDLSKFQSTYKSRQSDVNRLFKDLEKAGQFQGLESSKLKVLNDLRAFEVTVIKDKYYDQPQKDLEKLPEDTVPVTYAEAQKRLNKLSKTIESSPRAMETIELHQKEAIKALTRSQNTLKEIRWVDENTDKGLEHIVLHYHRPLDRAFPAVVKEDHSELLFEDQVSKYSFLVTNIKSSLQKEVSGLDDETIAAEAKKLADLQIAESKKALEAEHGKALASSTKQQEEAIAKAKQEDQTRFELEKKQLTEKHKKEIATVVAERDKLKKEHEQVTLALAKLKKDQQLAAQKKQLNDQKDKEAIAKKEQDTAKAIAKSDPQPKATSQKVVAQKSSAPVTNSVAKAPDPITAPKQSVSASTPVESGDGGGSFGFDFEIEDIDL